MQSVSYYISIIKMNYFHAVLLALTCIFGNEVVTGKAIQENLNEFSIDLYKEIIKENSGSFVYSCYSIGNVLTLTALGSRGVTASQIKSALKLNIPNQQIENNSKEVEELLKKSQPVTIETANKLYLAKNFVIESEFSKTAVDTFNAGIENIDFTEPDKAVETINSWVEKKTHNKIRNLLDNTQVSSGTSLVLVNTLYFSGKWKHQFQKRVTEKKDFHNTKSDIVKVDMMTMYANLQFYKDTSLGASILTLPYENTNAELVLVLPDDIGLKAVENNVQKLWENRNYTEAHVKVSLPKFRVESTIDMIPLLKKLGITQLFQGADLSGITKGPLDVTTITQKTYIDVNEYGTEAASATALVADRTEVVPSPNEQVFNVDRPFLFAILYDGIEILSGRVEKL